MKGEKVFIAELENMDLTSIKNENFLVAASSGDRNSASFIAATLRGPFTFAEMCEIVSSMWREKQHHAKVILLEKDIDKPFKFLDENTVDYIEAKYLDILTEDVLLSGAQANKEDYTCKARVIEHKVLL